MIKAGKSLNQSLIYEWLWVTVNNCFILYEKLLPWMDMTRLTEATSVQNNFTHLKHERAPVPWWLQILFNIFKFHYIYHFNNLAGNAILCECAFFYHQHGNAETTCQQREYQYLITSSTACYMNNMASVGGPRILVVLSLANFQILSRTNLPRGFDNKGQHLWWSSSTGHIVYGTVWAVMKKYTEICKKKTYDS